MWPLPMSKIIEYVVVVAVVLLLVAFIYKKGGDAPRAELHALKASYEAAEKAAADKDKLKKSASDLIVGMLDKEAKDAKADAAAGWAAYGELRKSGNRRSPGGAESIRTVARVCEDPGTDDRLSDAIQKYRVGFRAAMDDVEQRTGLLLEQAGVQAIDLTKVNTWAVEQHKLNSQ